MTHSIQMFVPVAIRALADQLVSRFLGQGGTCVTQNIDLNPAIFRRLSTGEAFDIGLTNPHFVDGLVEEGLIDRASRHRFGRVPLAIGRRKGSSDKVVARDGASVSALLNDAKTVLYVGAGTSGKNYLTALNRLRLEGSVGPKSIAAQRGTLAASLMTGKADLMAAPLTTLLAHPGLEPAAILPRTLGCDIELDIFMRLSPKPGTVPLSDFLTSAELGPELRQAGVLRE